MRLVGTNVAILDGIVSWRSSGKGMDFILLFVEEKITVPKQSDFWGLECSFHVQMAHPGTRKTQ